MLVFSAHADTGFDFHFLSRRKDHTLFGHLDNFIGVHAVMQAFFSGRIANDYTRIVLTKDEEIDMAGARELVETLSENDLVIAIDVTGAEVESDIVFEKCAHPALQAFLRDTMQGLSFEIDPGCHDPIASEDEVDIYSQKCPFTCMLGIRVWGGDYNEGPVFCSPDVIETAVEAICRLCEAFPEFSTYLKPARKQRGRRKTKTT